MASNKTPVTSTQGTVFAIPSHYDIVYYNKPDCKSVLVHSYSSSFKEAGFQAILCFHSQPFIPAHLGLPEMKHYEDMAFLQVAVADQPFVLQSQVAPGQWMQITITEYLILLQFIAKEWARIAAKLNYQLKTMREGAEPIHISGRLVFYNHGSSYFKTNLSSRLLLKAWIESGDVTGTIHCCLEKKVDYCDAVELMTLPMESLTTMAQDASGMKAMTEILAYYKSRGKK